MPGYKLDRLSSDVTFELSEIFRTLKDPRVTRYLLTIVRVDITNDLSYATVYVGAMEGLEAAKQAVVGLKAASGYIRRELAARVKMRKVPELRFVADNSIEHSAHIARVLESIKTEDGENHD